MERMGTLVDKRGKVKERSTKLFFRNLESISCLIILVAKVELIVTYLHPGASICIGGDRFE